MEIDTTDAMPAGVITQVEQHVSNRPKHFSSNKGMHITPAEEQTQLCSDTDMDEMKTQSVYQSQTGKEIEL